MMNQTQPLIRTENASLISNKKVLLQNISLCIYQGQIVTLIGPNGAGKTSLLKLLIGQYKASSGTVVRNAHCRLGYMPQRLQIDRSLPLSVERFLALAGNTNAAANQQILQEVGAAHLQTASLQTLSGGELQRVMLARALLREPTLLVLDEPAQSLDMQGQRELYQLLLRIREQRQCGILMVSHDLHLVMADSDQVICLNQHICCSGSTDSVRQHPEYLALFGEELGDEFAIYTHQHDHSHLLNGNVKTATSQQTNNHIGCKPHEHD